jgi:inward rectifier potassium channel
MLIRGSRFQLYKLGLERYDWSDPYHLAVTLSWRVFMGFGLTVLIALNLIFAALYLLVPGAVQNLKSGDLLSAFFFSLETLATVGYGEMAPVTLYGHAVSAIEIIIGMVFTAIMTGLLFVRFSKPESKILFAEKAVVAVHNGKMTLMVRIANGRLTMMTGAGAHFGLMLAETTAEGHRYGVMYDLALVRTAMPIFPLTWTLMHVIEGESPLKGVDPEMLRQRQARLFVSVSAVDVVLGARIQAVQDYGHEDVAVGMRYSEAVTQDEEGRTLADISRLSRIEPDEAAGPGVRGVWSTEAVLAD